MGHGILLSATSDIDVMVHGVWKYSFFGHKALLYLLKIW